MTMQHTYYFENHLPFWVLHTVSFTDPSQKKVTVTTKVAPSQKIENVQPFLPIMTEVLLESLRGKD